MGARGRGQLSWLPRKAAKRGEGMVRKVQHQKPEESLHEPSEDTAMARDEQIPFVRSKLGHITAFLRGGYTQDISRTQIH